MRKGETVGIMPAWASELANRAAPRQRGPVPVEGTGRGDGFAPAGGARPVGLSPYDDRRTGSSLRLAAAES